MDISSGIQAAALDTYSAKTGDSVTTLTMNKALNIQATNAAMLIQSARESAPTPAQNLPSHLGQNLNVTA